MKNILKFIICVSILFLIPCVSRAYVYTYGDTNLKETKINMQYLNGENVIILPSSSEKGMINIFGDFPEGTDIYVKTDDKEEKFFSGASISTGENNVLYFTDKNGVTEDFSVKLLFSENVPAVYLVSDNPTENGREWVEASPGKKHKATGFMVIMDKDKNVVYSDKLSEIKGRGNSTWTLAKKPYQIKLPEKADLLCTGKDENKSKTWVLLANYVDPSLLNNSVVLGLGKDMGMKTYIENTHVDLYYDGEYRGNYLLSEKVEVGNGRVDITDLEEKNASLNTSEEFPVKTAVTENGAEYTYCDGLVSPEDITGGYLLEMDYEIRAKEEVCYFKTTRNQYVVVKSPEFASKEEMDYIATLYQGYEDAVYNGGVNPATGKKYSDYVDRESVAVYYLLNEFSKARDFFGSSAYLYKNAGEDIIHMGPLWDYDLGFTEGRFDSDGEETPCGLSIYNTDFGAKLSEIDDFSVLLEEMYSEKLLPLINEGISEDFLQKSNEIKASATLDSMLWHTKENYEENIIALLTFMRKRADYLDDAFSVFSEIDHSKKPFIDVLPGAWYEDFVKSADEKGYMNGISELCFDPYSPVRRSEAAQVLFNMSGREDVEFKAAFSDVSEADWFSDAVLWAEGKGIMTGSGDGKFLPTRYITREELISVLYRYKNPAETNENLIENFRDWENISSFATDAFNWAVSEGITEGDANGCLNPRNYLTRAELAAILVRANENSK